MTVSGETLRSISTPEPARDPARHARVRRRRPSRETASACTTTSTSCTRLNVVPQRLCRARRRPRCARASTRRAPRTTTILIFSELMESESLFLTANADTVYFLGIVDLTSGPMVVETPPQALALFDDMWFQWIVDFGLPGPDRGEGGRFLLVPPGYDGPLPDSGYHVRHSRTTRAVLLGRSFMVDERPGADGRGDQAHAEDLPLRAGRLRDEHRDAARGPCAAPIRRQPIPETTFVEGSGKAFNTIPPSRLRLLRAAERAGPGASPRAARDIELMGQLAAIGIVKGKPFEPDERMRRDPRGGRRRRERDLARPGLRRAGIRGVRVLRRRLGVVHRCCSVGGYSFETPPPLVTDGGDQAVPRDRRPDAERADLVLLRATPGSRPRCACGSPESGRSTSSPPRTPTATASTARGPTG